MRKRKHLEHRILKKRSIAQALLIICATIFFTLISYYSYNYAKPVDIKSLLLIKKSAGVLRIIPKDSSGFTASHQNKNIYNNFKSGPIKEDTTYNSISKHKNSEAALIILKDAHLNSNNTINSLDNNHNDTLLSFGMTSTRAAALNKLKRLLKSYPELINHKLTVQKISETRYKLKITLPMQHNNAIKIMTDIKKLGEECDVER